MSSSLKEKLKRMGRSRCSPLASSAVAQQRSFVREKSNKSAKQTSATLEHHKPVASLTEEHLKRNEPEPEDIPDPTVDYESFNEEELQTYKKTLEMRILKKRESLRKLELAKLYRTKNDLLHLDQLIEKWKQVSQDGVQELRNGMPDPKPSLTQLIDYLQIDHKLIGYLAEEESFVL